MPTKLLEAATVKNRAKRMVRDAAELLKDKSVPDDIKAALESVSAALKKTWGDLGVVKKMGAGRKGVNSEAAKKAEDYLVVEDPEKSTTFHLQVMKAGKADKRLMGAAWAALHSGFRGNKYEGPGKAAAITKLKKMYADMDMDTPAESDAGPADLDLSESGYGSYDKPWVPWGVTSFSDLDTIEATEELAEEIRERTNQFTGMVSNIMYASPDQIPDKIEALTILFDEFTLILDATLGADPGDMGESGDSAAPESPTPETDAIAEVQMAESLESQAVVTVDGEIAEAGETAKPFELSVQIIKPGWGNTRDNHYYPAEMLRRDAKKFEGAKMYETDHRDAEKSTRTWVSTVKEISGFTDDGAPIARVVVHDPSFVERLRNLNAASMLEKMECSILASGSAKNGFELDGRKGRVVESITDVSAVDWVTKAGAGGRAMSIAESDAGAGNTPETTDADEVPEVPVVPEVPAEDVPAEEVPASEEPTPESAATSPAYLTEADIAPLIARLARPVADKIKGGQYATVAEVKQAIEAEIAYIKSITGSGSVALLGETARPRQEIRPTQVAESILAVNKKFGF